MGCACIGGARGLLRRRVGVRRVMGGVTVHVARVGSDDMSDRARHASEASGEARPEGKHGHGNAGPTLAFRRSARSCGMLQCLVVGVECSVECNRSVECTL